MKNVKLAATVALFSICALSSAQPMAASAASESMGMKVPIAGGLLLLATVTAAYGVKRVKN